MHRDLAGNIHIKGFREAELDLPSKYIKPSG